MPKKKITQKRFDRLAKEAIMLNEVMPDSFYTNGEAWKPEYWVAKGYQRNWGDAAVMSPFFEVLRKQDEETGYASFIILCPSFLRRPLSISAKDLRAWGSY
jgi:hypothetical protein